MHLFLGTVVVTYFCNCCVFSLVKMHEVSVMSCCLDILYILQCCFWFWSFWSGVRLVFGWSLFSCLCVSLFHPRLNSLSFFCLFEGYLVVLEKYATIVSMFFEPF